MGYARQPTELEISQKAEIKKLRSLLDEVAPELADYIVVTRYDLPQINKEKHAQVLYQLQDLFDRVCDARDGM